jgi:uncharacterized membrane protein
MADIGIDSRRSRQRDTLFAPMASMGQAAVTAAGPWLFTIIALALIGVLTDPVVGSEALDSFRVFVIYAFALSLVATAPVVMIATRLAGDALYLRKFAQIRPLFVAATALGAIATALVSLFTYTIAFTPAIELALVGSLCCTLVGMIWIGLAFCGAVRDFAGITRGFLLGLLTGVVCTFACGTAQLGVAGMLAGFSCGLAFIFFWLATRVLVTFPQPAERTLESLIVVLVALRRYWALSIGALAGALAIWIDKWIMWTGPLGERVASGLAHAPGYDSAMFIAYLAIIPSLAVFVTDLETTFFEVYKRYFAAIANHATLAQVRSNSRELEGQTMRTIAHIILIQFVLGAIVALAAPLIVRVTGLQFQQTAILRLGALGAMFQFVLVACSTLLLFFERHVQFMLLQILFLIMQAGLTLITVALGSDFYGVGYLFSCVVCGLLSFFTLEHTLKNLDYLTFIVANREDKPTMHGEWERAAELTRKTVSQARWLFTGKLFGSIYAYMKKIQ